MNIPPSLFSPPTFSHQVALFPFLCFCPCHFGRSSQAVPFVPPGLPGLGHLDHHLGHKLNVFEGSSGIAMICTGNYPYQMRFWWRWTNQEERQWSTACFYSISFYIYLIKLFLVSFSTGRVWIDFGGTQVENTNIRVAILSLGLHSWISSQRVYMSIQWQLHSLMVEKQTFPKGSWGGSCPWGYVLPRWWTALTEKLCQAFGRVAFLALLAFLVPGMCQANHNAPALKGTIVEGQSFLGLTKATISGIQWACSTVDVPGTRICWSKGVMLSFLCNFIGKGNECKLWSNACSQQV